MAVDGTESARADRGEEERKYDVKTSRYVRRESVLSGRNILRCIYNNAGSIVGMADELRSWIRTCNYDIVAMSETWLKEGLDWKFNHPGFRYFRRDRTGRGG